jgi:hypothetical protein
VGVGVLWSGPCLPGEARAREHALRMLGDAAGAHNTRLALVVACLVTAVFDPTGPASRRRLPARPAWASNLAATDVTSMFAAFCVASMDSQWSAQLVRAGGNPPPTNVREPAPTESTRELHYTSRPLRCALDEDVAWRDAYIHCSA